MTKIHNTPAKKVFSSSKDIINANEEVVACNN